MADIELVVKIDEEDYKEVLNINNRDCTWNNMHRCYEAVLNGTPLPKGHGDIVDIETLIDMFWDGNSMEITKYDLSVIEPIIEADKKERSE